MTTPRIVNGDQVPERPNDIIDDLGQAAWVSRRYARMHPTDRQPTENEVKAARNDARRYLQEHGISSKRLSRELGSGFSPSVISQVLSGSYRVESDDKLKAILKWIENDEQSRESKLSSDLVVTHAVKRMMTAIDGACKHQSIAVIIAPAGLCKSTVLQAAHQSRPGSVYVSCMESTSGMVSLLRQIAEAMGVRGVQTSAATLQMKLIRELSGTKKPLLIDEAQRLQPRAFGVLRDFCDRGNPVVIAGSERLRKLIDDTADGSQFISRCEYIIDMMDMLQPGDPSVKARPATTIDEVIRICSAGKLKFTGDARDMLFALANTPFMGALRSCKLIVQAVADLPGQRTRPIEAKTLWGALRSCKGIVYKRVHEHHLRRTIEALPAAKSG